MKTLPHFTQEVFQMAVKISDIARSADVSPATVSRVLHNSGYVGQKKREIILQVIKDLNYVPNRVAQGLKSSMSYMIGHILPQPYPNPYYSEISRGADLEAYENGFHVLTLSSYRDKVREDILINDMMSRKVDGIIFSTVVSPQNLEKVKLAGIHIVVIERMIDSTGVDKVAGDNFEGSVLAVEHLLDKNHREIAYIGSKYTSPVETDRYNGYCSTLQNRDIGINENIVKFTNSYSPDDGYKAAKELIKSGRLPTAVFVSSDMLVTGVLQAFYSAGIRVPDDISIIGFDNTYAKFVSPMLTTVAVPMEDMGRAAVQLIIDKIKNKENTFKTIILHPKLVERESVKEV